MHFNIIFHSVFRIRIRSDPYHWPGSGNIDLDPGTKNFFLNKKLKITTKKHIVMSFKPYTEKIIIIKKKMEFVRF